MSVRVWDYKREYAALREEILDAIDGVFGSGSLILGASVLDFEAAFSKYCGVTRGVGVNSGTDALFLALKALGVGEGDEVITVANTAVPTVSAIVSTGARPIFVDISPDTYLMDVGAVENAIGPATKCILPVHLFGQCVDMNPLRDIADFHRLPILEDCAQSTGATYRGRRTGALGSIAAFSFYPTKILGGYGDGGMIVTDDTELFHKTKRLRQYGMDSLCRGAWLQFTTR